MMSSRAHRPPLARVARELAVVAHEEVVARRNRPGRPVLGVASRDRDVGLGELLAVDEDDAVALGPGLSRQRDQPLDVGAACAAAASRERRGREDDDVAAARLAEVVDEPVREHAVGDPRLAAVRRPGAVERRLHRRGRDPVRVHHPLLDAEDDRDGERRSSAASRRRSAGGAADGGAGPSQRLDEPLGDADPPGLEVDVEHARLDERERDAGVELEHVVRRIRARPPRPCRAAGRRPRRPRDRRAGRRSRRPPRARGAPHAAAAAPSPRSTGRSSRSASRPPPTRLAATTTRRLAAGRQTVSPTASRSLGRSTTNEPSSPCGRPTRPSPTHSGPLPTSALIPNHPQGVPRDPLRSG